MQLFGQAKLVDASIIASLLLKPERELSQKERGVRNSVLGLIRSSGGSKLLISEFHLSELVMVLESLVPEQRLASILFQILASGKIEIFCVSKEELISALELARSTGKCFSFCLLRVVSHRIDSCCVCSLEFMKECS